MRVPVTASGPGSRAAQRLETRERVFHAAVAEFQRDGADGADIRAIVEAAGVARGTFYFHFPTRQHVLAELERREDLRVAAELERFFAGPHDLEVTLREVVRAVLRMERRRGTLLFRDLVAYQSSSTRPKIDRPEEYCTVMAVVDELIRARDRGEVFAGVDPVAGAEFFLLGLNGVLAAHFGSPKRTRAERLDKYVASSLRSLAIR